VLARKQCAVAALPRSGRYQRGSPQTRSLRLGFRHERDRLRQGVDSAVPAVALAALGREVASAFDMRGTAPKEVRRLDRRPAAPALRYSPGEADARRPVAGARPTRQPLA